MMETTWKVQSSSDDVPVRLKYIECLEKIEASLHLVRTPIPKDTTVDYNHSLPTIIFATVVHEAGKSWIEMICYADRKAFRRALRDEQRETVEDSDTQ
jgi:hypothetical protein